MSEANKNALKEDSFICIDPVSYLVVESKIKLMYSIDSTALEPFDSEVPTGVLIPLYLYERTTGISEELYDFNFPLVRKSEKAQRIFLAVFISLGGVFLVIAIILLVLHFKSSACSKEDSNEREQGLLKH